MSLICRLSEAPLARLALLAENPRPGSLLGRHLRRCAGCRSILEDYRRLDASLHGEARLLAAELPLFGGRPVGAASGVRAVLACAAALLALSRPASAPSLWSGPAPLRITAGVRITTRAHTAPQAHVARVRRRAVTPLLARRSPDTTHPLPQAAHPQVASALRAVPQPELAIPAPDLPCSTKPGSEASEQETAWAWAALGRLYEAREDYHRAEAAYGRALTTLADPEVTLDAGRVSERVGDVEVAVGYYAEVLQQLDSRSEKGPTL